MKCIVIGCGSIGLRHSRNFAAAGCEVAVIDQDAVRRDQAAQETGARAFATLDEALAWQPDMAVIAVPHRFHVPLALELLDRVRALLIEKPLTLSANEAKRFQDRAQQSDTLVRVVSNMRFHPGVASLREALDSIGEPHFARAHYGNYLPAMRADGDYRKLYCAHASEGGGVIYDAIHEMDYLCSFFGQATGCAGTFGRIGTLDIDVEDWASIVLTHATGMRSSIHLDYLRNPKSRGCEIVGTQGTILWESLGKAPEACRVTFADSKSRKTLFESAGIDTNQPYLDMAKNFTALVDGGVTDDDRLASVDDGAHVVALAETCKQSLGSSVALGAEFSREASHSCNR
ncbi:Gfo/Idh/MocA family oxidoreductase [Hwanghaeella grinnelliae]|uniref:Gfo/Idh/MocA family oxidoreductase n=1 Tax=Hwanghaeella grinnelliae TaxID=2500179 RepID=A0A3S3UPI0_9PROT|nr:Gfo/Idh/MocA family oxidoreductase [Hwanghaeella grinnelliae]RVU36761.1 Gfo/Idh/MocA family oxidoreductase [Hwanghaeella grinnelliae]